MRKIIYMLIFFIAFTSLSYSQTRDNYSRYMFPTITLNTGITWAGTHDLRQTPMNSFGVNIYSFIVEYNTDVFMRFVDDYTVQQLNIGYSFGVKNTGGGRNRHNKDYITIYGGRFWEKDIDNYMLQDKYVVGVRINSDIRNRFHIWGKVDTNLSIGICVGIKLGKMNPLFKRRGCL